MKRWLLYLALLAAAALSPIPKTDIAKLIPVEVVWLAEEDGMVYLQTDTAEQGWGENVHAALENLKASAYGNVFLETADYVIVEQWDEALLEQCQDLLRPSCKVCASNQMPDMETVAIFLAAHEPEITMRHWQVEGLQLRILNVEEGRLAWSGK